MTNRPWRSGATQKFAVPDEDDIYNDSPASIALLEEEFEPVEDTNSPSFPDNTINETLAAFFYDADSNSNSILTVESQSTTPSTPTPRPNTPTTLTGTQFLKRKRQSSTPHRGARQKDKIVWKHSRQQLPYEPTKDDHGHEIFYCAGDNCKWKGSSGNETAHLWKHAIFVRRYSATPSTIAQANSLQQGLHNMAAKKAEFKHDQTATILCNAAQKQEFRNALARFVTACSLSHNSVVSKEF
jgi:hypothetical protein